MLDLEMVDFLGDGDNGLSAFLQMRGQCGYGVGLFLEDEGGEEGNNLFRGELGEDVLEDKFCQNELVCRVDLR